MVEHAIVATSAHVTLDVALPGIVWGWIITMNMWAKSIATGVVFVGAYLLKKHPSTGGNIRISMPIISLIFIHITLLFTVLDLHQMFRFWHIFAYPHFTSAITVGAWAVTGFVGVLFLMAFMSVIKKDNALFDKLMWIAVVLAIPSTLYTAAIMGSSTGRELWQTPAELVQMMLAAALAGSAIMLIVGYKFEDKTKKDLAFILGMSAALSFLIYMGEYFFGHMKAEEVAATIAFIKDGGEYAGMFWLG
jgi:formate-dependent nitrite reductase membrane component NrfD